MCGLLTEMGNEIHYFGYPHLLAERVHSLVLEIKEKNVVISSAQSALSTVEVRIFIKL